MKKYLFLIIIIVVALTFCSCGKAPTVSTPLGEFEYKQAVQTSVSDSQNINTYAASAGNILLIAYLTPDKENTVTIDQAQAFFNSGSQVEVGGKTYDKVCILYEKTGDKVRYGLVFEIPDNNYDNNHQPTVDNLKLPKEISAPTSAPAETPAPAESAAASTEPIPTSSAS
jgi:hypothetical protein